MNNTIWMYWEDAPGKRKPDYLKLCFETIVKNKGNNEIIVVTPENVKDFLPDISPRIFKIRKIAHRADYIRGRLLHKYGGIWLDSDVIILKPLDLSAYLVENDFVGYGKDEGEPSINFFAAKANSPLLKSWVDGMDKKLLGLFPKYKLKWTEIGYNILWPYSRDYQYSHIKYELIAPIGWQDWEKYFDTKLKLRDLISEETIAMMLFNKNMFDRLENMNREEIMNSQTLLGEAFRYALDN